MNFSEILIEIQTVSFKKMYLKLSSAKWPLLRLGLNVLMLAHKTLYIAYNYSLIFYLPFF